MIATYKHPVTTHKQQTWSSWALTGNVPVAIFQSTEVCHELPHRDLENFKQTRVLEKGVCHLRKHKPALLKHQSELQISSTITDVQCNIKRYWTLQHMHARPHVETRSEIQFQAKTGTSLSLTELCINQNLDVVHLQSCKSVAPHFLPTGLWEPLGNRTAAEELTWWDSYKVFFLFKPIRCTTTVLDFGHQISFQKDRALKLFT